MSSAGFGDQPGQTGDEPGQPYQPGPHSQPGEPGSSQPGTYGQTGGAYGQTGASQPGAYGQAGPYNQGSAQQAGWQGPPSPQYGQPGPYVQAGWPQLSGRRTNSLAIASLCCAIGQVVAGPFAGIAAIVLGGMSLKQIRETGEDGHGMAVTGLVLGIAGLILGLLATVFILAFFHDVTSNLNNN